MPTYLSPGVYVEEAEAGSRPIEGVGTAVAAFVGLAATGPVNTPTLVTNWSQYTKTFGEFVEGSYLAHSVYGYFLNGGGSAYIVRVGADSDGNGAAASAAASTPVTPPAALSTTPEAIIGSYRVAVKPAVLQAGQVGQAAPPVTVEIGDAGEGAPDDSYIVVVKRGEKVEETIGPVTSRKGKDNIVTAIRERSRILTIEDIAGAPQTRPEKGVVELHAPAASQPSAESQVQTGTIAISPEEYVGDVSQRTGLGGLETIDEITMVSVPDLMSAYEQGAIDKDTVKAVQLGIIAHCELMGDRMAILDPLPDLNPQQMKEWRGDGGGFDSKYAALYYPWVQVFDPPSGTNKFIPPSGYMAGIWARNDNSRGVHKAPANEVIRGAVSLGTDLTRQEQELLNPMGVNCLRSFPGRGTRVWGARTLSSDPAWRYLNVRRLFNYLEESILGGTQWVVFEPNDDALWARIRRTISAFLVNEWRKGALFGLTPDEAFYVKCDRETNPAEAIDAGQVLCEIGIAPVKPAEFVVFRLSQFSGGTSLVAE